MSSLFGTNLEQEKKSAAKRGGGMTSTRREPRDQATHSGLAASLWQTSARWCDLFWACQVASQKQARCLADVERDGHDLATLSGFTCMLALRLLKGGRRIALVMDPHGKDDPHPHIGQRSHSYGMTFAFSALALVILPGPRLALRGLPGKLVQRIAQRFNAAQTSMRLGVHAALKQHGRGSSQRLQTAGILIPLAIITDFGKPPRGQSLAGTRQARKELMVLMGQKKGLNLFIVLSNLLEQRQQLTHQHQHQARFGARDHGIGLQMGLMQPLEDRSRDRLRIGMLGLPEDFLDLFRRNGHR